MNGHIKLWQVKYIFHSFDHFNESFETFASFLELADGVMN